MNNQTECNAIKPINSGAVHRICSGQVSEYSQQFLKTVFVLFRSY